MLILQILGCDDFPECFAEFPVIIIAKPEKSAPFFIPKQTVPVHVTFKSLVKCRQLK
jgi:hypothetical protein